jgi:hypothetical protein
MRRWHRGFPVRQLRRAARGTFDERELGARGRHRRSSREQWEAYGENLMPILDDMGIEYSAEPEIFEVLYVVK